VVIDQRVDVVEPDLVSSVAVTGGAAVGTPAATVGDTPDLLDVHVHQLAGPVAFVAHRGGLAGPDDRAGDRVSSRKYATR